MDGDGIARAYCTGRFDHVLRRVVREIEAHTLEVSAVVDFSGDVHEAQLDLPETKLLLFGAPNLGAELVHAHRLVALELPLKLLLVAADGSVLLAYNETERVRRRYGLTAAEAAPFEVVESVVRAVTGGA